jgi:hypothetical protein
MAVLSESNDLSVNAMGCVMSLAIANCDILSINLSHINTRMEMKRLAFVCEHLIYVELE